MSLADLDQSNYCQFTQTWLGPTIGWVMLPVMPQTFVTTGTDYVVVPYDSLVLLGPAARAVKANSRYVTGVR